MTSSAHITHDGRNVRVLNLIDKHTRENLLVRAERRWSSARVISALADVMIIKGSAGVPSLGHCPRFRRERLAETAGQKQEQRLYIEPDPSLENGHCESFNFKLRDEFLHGEIFYSTKELRMPARMLARSLQHRPATLFIELQNACTGGMAHKQ